MYPGHSYHTPAQGRLWLHSALRPQTSGLGWHLIPVAPTEGLRTWLGWYRGGFFTEKAVITARVAEGAHWH